MEKLIVIGGGPAGIMAALTAAGQGYPVELWERNKQLGRKLSITGKGRCNITNDCTDLDELVKNIPGNGAFLYGALSRFTPRDVMDFFEGLSVPLKTERGRRVFPCSDRAWDVVDALSRRLEDSGVRVFYGCRAKHLFLQEGAVRGVYDFSGALHPASAVVLATGGMSYPQTGSSGDGYGLAEEAGHSIRRPRPSLVPLETKESWPAQLSGLSLRNVEMSLWRGESVLRRDFGEMLFTHFGVSGPLVLSISQTVCSPEYAGEELRLSIDLKPALNREQLDARLQRDFAALSRKQYQNSLNQLLPGSLIPVFVALSGIPGEKPVNQLSREERQAILSLLKALPLQIKGPRPLAEAIVTAGGVNVKEVNPKSMASRLVKGLYFAGEVLDVDGYTGGYNLQAAWSTGYVAGISVAWGL
ncbi:MAG: NAD(P)/FAD-dependent oxidoreductase [Bacillota bacterium]|nr:NAD(P)/FAD-dependent oxidoreductase [Bacillota bacterium]